MEIINFISKFQLIKLNKMYFVTTRSKIIYIYLKIIKFFVAIDLSIQDYQFDSKDTQKYKTLYNIL